MKYYLHMVTNGDSGGHGSDRMFNDVTIVAMDPLARDYVNTAHGTNWYAKRRTNTRITTHWLINYLNHCELILESCYFHDVHSIFNEYLGLYELTPTCTLFISINVITYAYRQVSNISRTKSQHLKDSRTVLRLSLPNPLKPDVKSTMKM